MNIGDILRPRSIAVVGASPRSFVGQIALRNCQALGYGGTVHAVHPRHREVAGLPAVPSLAAIDEPPDVVLVQVGTDRVLTVVEEALACGVRAFVIPGAGFTDSGDAATKLHARLGELAVSDGVQVVGPNCMGWVDLVTGAAPYIGTVPPHVRRGAVAVVAQSGAIVEAIVNAGGRVPLSTIVSSGAEATTSCDAYLRFFAQDPHTRAVLAFVEGFSDADAFLASARALAEAGKPLAVCKVGRSEVAKRGITAHSGQLAGSARIAAAALEQVGAIVCDDLDELIAAGEVLGTGRLPRGRRLHVVTNSGGEANMLADIADQVGLDLPPISAAGSGQLRQRWPSLHVGNPLDPWGIDGYEDVYPAVLRAAAEERGDVLMVALDQQLWCGDYEKALGRNLAAYLADAARDRDALPVFLSPTSQDPDPELARHCRERGIPLLRGARVALAVLAKLARRRAPTLPAAQEQVGRAVATLDGSRSLDEVGALDVLRRRGVAVPALLTATTADEAVTAARALGYPVVLKGIAPGLAHKTELGVVHVGLATEQEVRAAAQAILEVGTTQGVPITVLVMELVRGSLELIVGFERDAQFGPVTLVGLGGVWTEFLDLVALRVGPVDRAEALRMLDDCVVGRMLHDARGGALAIDELVTVICAVAAVGQDHPDIASIDVNPVIIGHDRAVAVDALIERTNEKRVE